MADDIARLGYEIDSTQARTAAGDLDKLNAASVRVAKGYDSLSNASRDLLRDEKGKFMGAQVAAAKYASEIDMLRSKYNPLYAASKQLAASQDEIRRALELGAITSKQASNAMDVLEAKFGVTGRAAMVMGKQVQASTQHTTNLMFQFQDIGMMLAAGQNPLMLAMQQGTQVSGVFQQMKNSGQSAFSGIKAGLLAMASPMALATIGVIAGVAALTQWAASAWGASEDADKLAEKVTDIATAANSYKSAIDAAAISTVDLVSKFGMQAVEMQRLYDLQVQLQRIQLQQKIQEFSSAAAVQYSGLANQLEKIVSLSKAAAESTLSQGTAQDLLNKSVANLRNEYGLGVGQALALSAAIDEIGQADTMDKQAAAAQRFGEELVKASDGGAMIPPEMVRLAIEAGVAADTIRQLEGALLDAAGAASSIRMPGAGGGRGDPRQFSMADEFRAQLASQDAWKAPTKPKGRKGGGGGGGREDQRAREMENFIKSLQTERETLEVWRVEQLELLAQYSDAELEAIGGKNEAKLRLEQEYSNQLVSIKQQEAEMVRSAASGMYGELTSLLSAFGQKSKAAAIVAIGINTALRIGETIQNTAAASVRALAELGPVAGAAAAARINAYGAAQVGLIAANGVLRASGAGGGGGGSVGGGSGAPASASGTTQQAQPERRVIVDIRGDNGSFIRNLIEPLMTQIYEQTGDGTKVIFSR